VDQTAALWGRLPFGDGRPRTRDIGAATVTLPGTPAPSVLDVSISPEQHVLFDGLRYGDLVFLCLSHSLQADPQTLQKYQDGVFKALIERFRKMYSNLSSERESGANTSDLQISLGEKRLGEFTIKSDGQRLVVLGVVSVSPEAGWSDAVVQQFFGSLKFRHSSPVLALVRTAGDLLVFTDPSQNRFFITPRIRFDHGLPPLLDFRSDNDSVRFAASLVWPDVLDGRRDALRDDLQKSGQTESLFRHNLAQVTVSLEIDDMVVHVWHDPGLKEDFELIFSADQPQYEALQKLAGSLSIRDSARLLLRAELLGEDARIEHTEKAFPPEVTLKIDRR
jgi:hypothetical protein